MKKTKPKRSYTYRGVIKKKSLYFYNCSGCGKKRSSRIYERALGKICQVCLKNKVPDNQQSLFNSPQGFGEAFEALAHHEQRNITAEQFDCPHLTDTFKMNEKGEWVCPFCQPELL